jgi:molybdate transport system substrate-binding protein
MNRGQTKMARYPRRRFLSYSLLGLLSACAVTRVNQQQAASINLTVSSASSLQDALSAIVLKYNQKNPNVKIISNFGSSGSLQQQIEQGAPVDIFISASPKQMKALKEKNFLITDTEKPLVGNQMVLIIPQGKTGISSFEQLTSSQVNKVVIGEPGSVPAGQYAQEILTNLGVYNSLTPKLVFAHNVRQALTYVEMGNVDAGIVFATEGKLSHKVKVVAMAPPKSHTPIIYPIAVLKNTKNPEAAKAFSQFLFSLEAQKVLESYGFTIIP